MAFRALSRSFEDLLAALRLRAQRLLVPVQIAIVWRVAGENCALEGGDSLDAPVVGDLAIAESPFEQRRIAGDLRNRCRDRFLGGAHLVRVG
ncbi:MAG: hypothetical protein WDO73_29435 [Ignavibacteriota bacterium]